jgi:uncharacterized membrane protein
MVAMVPATKKDLAMTLLFLGLIVFLGTHAFSMARGPRGRLVAAIGEWPYKGAYTVLSLLGIVLIVQGFGAYRAGAWINVWYPPIFTKHLALLLTLPIFVLFLAAYLPGRIKAATKHPMLLSVKIWAASHLLSNGDLGGMLLFGGFLAWAVMARISLKRRTEGSILDAIPSKPVNDIIALAGGLALWVVFVFWLHPAFIGVAVWPGR